MANIRCWLLSVFEMLKLKLSDFQKEYSNEREVVLHNVSILATEGIYKCQVSGEGPLFATEVQSKKLRVAGETTIIYQAFSNFLTTILES